MARMAARSGLSPQEYLAWERRQKLRHEYFRGEVFAMAGDSPRHNALCAALTAALHAAFRPRGCVVLSSDQRLGLDGDERYVYADVSVVCGGLALQAGTTDDGEWLYRATGARGRVVLAAGVEVEVAAIFEGVFDLAGDQ